MQTNTITERTIDGQTWLCDSRGNRNSVEYWGSRDAAERALKSLKNCDDCINCSYCSYCSGCSDCSGCSGCSGCLDCSYCSYCSGCSDCSGCSYCSGCSDCSNIAWLRNKKDVRGDSDASAPAGQPPIPTIPGIDRRVFDAINLGELKLNMETWHTCNTTHCRAGMVVHLAGEAGYALERFHNTPLAAQLIYRESGSPISPCRFYDSDEAALADMKKRAAKST